MVHGDLPLVAEWMSQPHVSRWWLSGSSLEREMEDVRRSVTGEQAVTVQIAMLDGEPVGWCQWYGCDEDPEWAADIGAGPADVGMDYAIGLKDHIGRGIGTLFISEMVRTIRTEHRHSSIFADPDERNVASRRVLEKNGFELLTIKPIPSEATSDPMAVYRLAPPA